MSLIVLYCFVLTVEKPLKLIGWTFAMMQGMFMNVDKRYQNVCS